MVVTNVVSNFFISRLQHPAACKVATSSQLLAGKVQQLTAVY